MRVCGYVCKYVRVARRALGCCLICDFHSDSTLFRCCCYFFTAATAAAAVVFVAFSVIIVDVRSLKLELMCRSSVGVVLLSG